MTASEPPGARAPEPLDPEQKVAFDEARELRESAVRGPSRVAAINGWSLIAFGGLSLLISLGSLPGLLVGGAILALGWNELQGRDLLLKLDPAGPTRLVRNQIGLIVVGVLYTGGKAWMATQRPDPTLAELEALLELPPGDLSSTLAVAYLVAGVGAVLAFGLTARYYRSRGARLAAYLESTPDWILELQRYLRR